MKIQLKGRR